MNHQIDVEQVLGKFRRWLDETLTDAEDLDIDDGRPLFSRMGGREAAIANGDSGEVGLVRLVEEFTALRHELKLQTKSGRGLQEQCETVLTSYREAIDALRAIEAKGVKAVRDAGKSLAEALADLDEALDRGYSELDKAVNRRRAEARSDAEAATGLLAELDRRFAAEPIYRRALIRSYHNEVRELVARRNDEEGQAVVDALIEGYSLVRRRLIRALRAEEIEPIDCVGARLDPETMIAVDAVVDPDLEPGSVVEEIRRGYTWQGRLLRYAEVRVAKAPEDSDEADNE